MNHFIVAIYDNKVQAYNRPFTTRTVAEAVRLFQDEVNRNHTDNMFHKHPEDYHLEILGTFNDDTGAIAEIPNTQRQTFKATALIKE